MADEKHVFIASRLTHGNFLFPVRLEISRDRVTRIQPSFIGAEEESIAISKVASVNIKTGLFWSDIRIDSTGGTNPIISHGHSKQDAYEIRDLVEKCQQDQPATPE